MTYAVRVQGVGKRYRIGTGQGGGQPTLAGDLLGLVKHPLRRIFPGSTGEDSSNERDFWALSNVTFDVQPGEVVGIIGKNGSGKSTLLKVLSRITPPTTGQVEMNGRVAALLEVGTGFHPDLTGRENVYLNGILLGMTTREIDRKFDEIVEFAQVERFIDTPVKRYSSGMYVRLAFSVASHLDSEILILDEVLAVGDVLFQRKCLDRSLQAARSGRTVLIVSHNLQAIENFCTRGLLFDKGRVELDQPMSAVVRSYGEKGLERRGEREWPDSEAGPHFPDGSVRLLAIRALDRAGEARTEFDVTEPITFEMEYRVVERRHCCTAHLYFGNASRTGRGEHILCTMDNVGTPWKGAIQPAGRYRARCTVPADLLNEGSYHIEFLVCTNPTSPNYATVADALTLTIRDAHGASGVRGDWEGAWPAAAVRPRLSWEHFRE